MTEKQGEEKENNEDDINLKDINNLNINLDKIKQLVKKESFSNIKNDIKNKFNEIEKDFSKQISFVKNNSTLIVLLVLLILQFVPNYGYLPWGGMWMRLTPQYLPQTDDWAIENVHNFYKAQIQSSVDQKYPNLGNKQKEKLINDELNKIVNEKKDILTPQIAELSKYFKSTLQYENDGISYTYIPDIDPYVYLRYAENYLKKGIIADKIVDGKYIDTHQFAPVANEISSKTIHPYVLAYIHKIFSFFNKNIPTMQSISYMPIIFSILSIIPAFFIARIFGGNLSGFFAGTLLSIHIAFLMRTVWGIADTDAYNIFFPLVIIWLFLLAFYENNLKKSLIYILLSGFLIGVYSLAWAGWWYILYFILGTILTYFGFSIAFFISSKLNLMQFKFLNEEYESINKNIIIMFVFIIVSVLSVSYFNSFEAFYDAVAAPLRVLKIKASSNPDLWPNVYTTVSELNKISFKGVADKIGNLILFLSLIGIIFITCVKNVYGKKDFKFSVLLIIWFLATMYTTTKGIRFMMLLIPPVSISFGIGAVLTMKYVSELAHEWFSINKKVSQIFLILTFILILTTPIKTSYEFAHTYLPLINDAWWNSLIAIKQNSSETAIITSWWDYGHHFKYIADRSVTFDGGSQNTQMAHWVGKLLTTDDEKLSIGILRMLDCGSYKGFFALNNITDIRPQSPEIDEKKSSIINATPKTIELLNKIVVEDKNTAKKVLISAGFTEEKTEDILKYTHCDPPEAFLITSDDMINKAGVWAHFGLWNFEKSDIIINVRKMNKNNAINYLTEKYDHTKDEAEQLYFDALALDSNEQIDKWIAPWPGFSSTLSNCQTNNKTIFCGNGFLLENHIPQVVVRQENREGKGLMNSYSFINENQEFEIRQIGKDYNGTGVGLSSMLIPTETGYENMFMMPPLEKSMFSRLYFQQGHGLKHYKLFKKERKLNGGFIHIWKVDWNGTEVNKIYDLQTKINATEKDNSTAIKNTN